MSHIIFLNGCGSSGKTSIARSLQHLSKTPRLHLGMDMLIEMMSPDYIPGGSKSRTGYFSFREHENDRGPTMAVENGPLGPQVFRALPPIARTLADFGNDMILDEVLLNDEVLRSYVRELKDHTVYFIGIFCDFHQMQEREILRRDRPLGLSNDQMDRVHQNCEEYYDLKINTTQRAPFECAKEILRFLHQVSDPKGFKKLEKSFCR